MIYEVNTVETLETIVYDQNKVVKNRNKMLRVMNLGNRDILKIINKYSNTETTPIKYKDCIAKF